MSYGDCINGDGSNNGKNGRAIKQQKKASCLVPVREGEGQILSEPLNDYRKLLSRAQRGGRPEMQKLCFASEEKVGE